MPELQPSGERVARDLFELLPGSRAWLGLVTDVLDELAALKVAVREADWSRVEQLGYRCLGLGHAAAQALVDEADAMQRAHSDLNAARSETAAMLTELAEADDAAASFADVRDALADQPELLAQMEESLALLEEGVTTGVPLLETLTGAHEPAMAAVAASARDAIVAGLSRGLLAVIHARFNLGLEVAEAFEDGIGASNPEDLTDAFEAFVADVADRLQALQLAVQGALAPGSGIDAVDACRSLARWLEVTVPRLAGAQAHAHAAAAALRGQGSGSAAEALGRAAARAGRLTREGIASHAATSSLALALEVETLGVDAQSLRDLAAQLPFPAELPNGRNTEIAHLEDAEEGEFVEVQGVVTQLEIGRLPDGKLISRLELLDPSSGARARAAVIFVHLRHAGMTGGSYCRLNGSFRHASVLADDGAAIEVDALPLAQLAEQSWLVAFLRSAEPWYEVWRNRANMWWSLGPHRLVSEEDPNAPQGAGELLFRPIVRRSGAE